MENWFQRQTLFLLALRWVDHPRSSSNKVWQPINREVNLSNSTIINLRWFQLISDKNIWYRPWGLSKIFPKPWFLWFLLEIDTSRLHPILRWTRYLSITSKHTWKIFSRKTKTFSNTPQSACNNNKRRKIPWFYDHSTRYNITWRYTIVNSNCCKRMIYSSS